MKVYWFNTLEWGTTENTFRYKFREHKIKIPLFNRVHLLYNKFGSCRTDIAFAMCACQHVLQELFIIWLLVHYRKTKLLCWILATVLDTAPHIKTNANAWVIEFGNLDKMEINKRAMQDRVMQRERITHFCALRARWRLFGCKING